jgi:RNA polymerase sigma-70 factor (ECF subfamily)
VKRWEETDDVFQNATIRLTRALSKVALDSSQHFWNLAAVQIRRELLDLAQHYRGSVGVGAKHHTDGACRQADEPGDVLHNMAADENEPASLEEWTRFHEQIEQLPADEREVFRLLWFDGLSQDQVTAVLGISLRTVKRRWQSARFLLCQALSGNIPP